MPKSAISSTIVAQRRKTIPVCHLDLGNFHYHNLFRWWERVGVVELDAGGGMAVADEGGVCQKGVGENQNSG